MILADPANRTKVLLLLTAYDTDEYVYRALNACFSGFLMRSLAQEELISAVRVAACGDTLIDPSVTQRLIARFAVSLAPPPAPPELALLTARERESCTWSRRRTATRRSPRPVARRRRDREDARLPRAGQTVRA
jgi:hypothetical protein